jgi:hypothetical protein
LDDSCPTMSLSLLRESCTSMAALSGRGRRRTVVQHTAILETLTSPMVDPHSDSWWLQGYNRGHFEKKSGMTHPLRNLAKIWRAKVRFAENHLEELIQAGRVTLGRLDRQSGCCGVQKWTMFRKRSLAFKDRLFGMVASYGPWKRSMLWVNCTVSSGRQLNPSALKILERSSSSNQACRRA